eukprot:2021403-Amphidinium_carterae.1
MPRCERQRSPFRPCMPLPSRFFFLRRKWILRLRVQIGKKGFLDSANRSDTGCGLAGGPTLKFSPQMMDHSDNHPESSKLIC